MRDWRQGQAQNLPPAGPLAASETINSTLVATLELPPWPHAIPGEDITHTGDAERQLNGEMD